ncbi:MAG TPA: porin family protein, partial [Saprospiraceae bacterium]|nr:porin family protein [Saprospiraceae bacterium]
MKKLLFSIVFLSFFNFYSNAQIGIRAGVNLSNITYDLDGGSLSFDNRVGFHFGLNKSFVLSNNFDFRPGIQYSIKGAKSDDTNISLGYIEVPLDFIYRTGTDGIFINLGPYLGFSMSAKADDVDVKENIESLDFGINVGAGYKFTNFSLGVQYGLGLSNIDKTIGDSGSAKNKCIGIYFV